jgi:membrane associated rhomboid family serine protease
MDWSLALVSQGIESIVDHSDETGWGLVVAGPDFDPAKSIIRQYRIENCRWPWRQKIRPDISFDWGSLAFVFLMTAFFWMSGRMDLDNAGLMNAAAVSRGEWWRLFTAVFLHADIAHLAANATFGLIFLGLAMGRYGTGVGLLAAYLAGVGGNLTTWLVFADHKSHGASGMVMGALGLLAAQSFFFVKKNPARLKYLVTGFIAGLLLFVLVGTNPQADVLAHVGGFVAGALLGCVLMLVPQLRGKAGINLFAGAVFSSLVCCVWWLALRGAK